MISGMLIIAHYHELLMDVVAAFLGYMAWQQCVDFNSRDVEMASWIGAQLVYEIMYYSRGMIIDTAASKRLHHAMCLGYLYFGWTFKTALSNSFFFASISNCFLSLMQAHPNLFTKLSFAVSFVLMRIVVGTWIMKKVLWLPAKGSEIVVIPMTAVLYVMQWWWLRKIIRRIKKAFKVSFSLEHNGGHRAEE